MASETKAQRAARLYREAADAYDALPDALHRHGLFGPLLSVNNLRDEADWLEQVMESMATGNDPA